MKRISLASIVLFCLSGSVHAAENPCDVAIDLAMDLAPHLSKAEADTSALSTRSATFFTKVANQAFEWGRVSSVRISSDYYTSFQDASAKTAGTLGEVSSSISQASVTQKKLVKAVAKCAATRR